MVTLKSVLQVISVRRRGGWQFVIKCQLYLSKQISTVQVDFQGQENPELIQGNQDIQDYAVLR